MVRLESMYGHTQLHASYCGQLNIYKMRFGPFHMSQLRLDSAASSAFVPASPSNTGLLLVCTMSNKANHICLDTKYINQ